MANKLNTDLYELSKNREHTVLEREFNGQKYRVKMMRGRIPISLERYNELSDEDKNYYAIYPDFETKTFITQEGLIFEQDVPVILRDGTTIYTDIIRPNTQEPVPVLVAWSAYGKQPYYGRGEKFTRGVPASALSSYTKDEGPDPLYWCRYGYAVANVDPRGIGHSEGNVFFFGHQEGEDGYDFIEWLGAQKWCNGKVGMTGNSYLSMIQWKIAAQNPPHLAAIAPWEGTGDIYREMAFEGGIPAKTFQGYITAKTCSNGWVEDIPDMYDEAPFANCPYWMDKMPEYEKITTPAYICAGWNHIHLRGTMLGYRNISSKFKWLRIHRDFEWPDGYRHENLEELRTFFDRYLKDIHNGWELTPKVRTDVMDVYNYDYVINRPEEEYPIPRTEYKKLYLNAENMTLSDESSTTVASASYDGNTGEANFDIVFNQETELNGYMKLKLWVSAPSYDDADLFVTVKKLSTQGEELPVKVFDDPHPGAWGKLKVSRRKLDEEKTTDIQPYHSHDCVMKLKDGEIVPVEIEINPTGRIWHKGQILRLEIAGRYKRDKEWFEPLQRETDNVGDTVIHTGAEYDSYLQIPVIPPKFKDGDFEYRGIQGERQILPAVPVL